MWPDIDQVVGQILLLIECVLMLGHMFTICWPDTGQIFDQMLAPLTETAEQRAEREAKKEAAAAAKSAMEAPFQPVLVQFDQR